MLELFAREKIEDMLDVFHAVDVAVDIYVRVVSRDRTVGFIGEANGAAELGNRARLLLGRDDIVEDVAVLEFQEVRGLARLHIYHRPDAAGVAIDAAVVGIADEEVTLGEELHDALHPCLHLHVLILRRHLRQLDAQARQHPCVVPFVQLVNAPPAVVRVSSRRIQQMIPQHPQKQMPRKIHMEGFHAKTICGDSPPALPIREGAITI